MTPIEKYEIISQKSAEINLPEYYKNDLHIHDRDRLIEDNPEEFVWVARTSGTHLFTMEEIRRNSSLLQPGVITDERVAWFKFEGGALSETTPDEIRKNLWTPEREIEAARRQASWRNDVMLDWEWEWR